MTSPRRLLTYLHVYGQLVVFTLKSHLEYRFNFVIQLFYGPAYVGVLYALVLVAYQKAPILAGWTREEGLLLFYLANLLYTASTFLFVGSIRRLVWSSVREGLVDFALTKPINPQFLLTLARPELQQLLLLASLVVLLIRHLWLWPLHYSWSSIFLFGLTYGLGWIILYCALTTYATIAFVVTKAEQIIEFFDKTADYSHYPLTIFPSSIQLIMVIFVPVAFYAYIPTLFLLGQGSASLVYGSIVATIIAVIINQLAWKFALRHYTSASS